MNLRLLIAFAVALTITSAYAGIESIYSEHRATRFSEDQLDLIEISLGYNYLHLGDVNVEPEHLHGADLSAFVNINRWLAIGGNFMGDWGIVTRHSFSGGSFDVDSRRYIYVFGPRVTVWRSSEFRIFVEALGGGVHAEAEASAGSFSQTASADGFRSSRWLRGGLEIVPSHFLARYSGGLRAHRIGRHMAARLSGVDRHRLFIRVAVTGAEVVAIARGSLHQWLTQPPLQLRGTSRSDRAVSLVANVCGRLSVIPPEK